jgi:hypothetical protein
MSNTPPRHHSQTVVEHMEIYWSLLENFQGSKLKLTKYDDEILEHFQREFPDFDLKATCSGCSMRWAAGFRGASARGNRFVTRRNV